MIQQCGISLLSLINDILDFSKLEADKVNIVSQPFALLRIVEEVVGLLGVRASEKQLTLSYHSDLGVPAWVLGDSLRVKQILTNLISNAVKFTDSGTVSVSSHFDQSKKMLQFSVKDTGMGMSLEAQSKLFQSFSQVHAETSQHYGGTGLGLAISKSLCEKMGGKIWVESEVGQGSTFSFTFVTEEAQAQKIDETTNPFAAFKESMSLKSPLRILVVEDSQMNQMVLLGLLGKLGYHADVACNGQEALLQVEQQQYDLVFMDCHMPILDGFEATRQLITKFLGKERPRIIAITASTTQEEIERCLESGMDSFMSKPIEIPALVQVLQECSIEKSKKRSNAA